MSDVFLFLVKTILCLIICYNILFKDSEINVFSLSGKDILLFIPIHFCVVCWVD